MASTDRTMADFVFVGFNSHVAALDRYTGEVIWQWKSPKGSCSFVSLLLDEDRLIASVNGYMYCLDPLTGGQVWMNPMKGFGLGMPSMVSVRGATEGSGGAASTAAANAAAAAAATVATTTAATSAST